MLYGKTIALRSYQKKHAAVSEDKMMQIKTTASHNLVHASKMFIVNLPISKITPEEIIYFSTSISKEKLVVACGDNIN